MEFWDLFDMGAPFSTLSGEFAAQVRVVGHAKEVRVYWKHLASKTIVKEALSLAYWPTAACRTNSPLGFCVAGKRDAANRNTVIEQWIMKEPLVSIPTPEGDPVFAPQGAESITAVYDCAVEGRDMVRCMENMLGQRNTILMKFWDSSEVCTLDLTLPHPLPSLVASPSGPGGLRVRDLVSSHSALQAMHHVTHGYCYYLANGDWRGIGVVFTDGDCDGSIDACMLIADVHDWANYGFADSDNYHPL